MTTFQRNLFAFALYLLVTLAITWPLATQLETRLAGFGYSDAYEMAHHIWWFRHALETGQPLFDQPLSGYPDGIDGVTLWANPLQFFPAWALALVLPVAVAYNVTLLGTMALNGWAMFALARHMTGRTGPALLAGVVYLAFPTMQGHLGAGHSGLLVQWPVPLYVYALLLVERRGDLRAVLVAALLFVLSAFGHTLQILYVTLPVTAVFALRLLVARDGRALARVIAACVIGSLALGVFLIPVASATFGTAAFADAGGSVRYSADLLAALTPSFLHPVFGEWAYTHRVLGINIDEGYAYVGLVAALLGGVAVARVRAARWWLGLALLAYLLSLGPLLKLYDQPVRVDIAGNETFVPLPAAIFDALPVLSLARTPGRFNFALALAVAALVGIGWCALWPRLGRARVPLTVAAAALILLEYQAFWPLPTTSAAVPAQIASLRDELDAGVVFNVPWDNLVAAKQALYLQTAHAMPMIAGHVTRSTPVDPAKLTLLETTLDPALLARAGADAVIVHREYDTGGTLETRAETMLGAPLYRDNDYAVFQVPLAGVPTAPLVLPTDALSTSDRVDSFVWAPEPGWLQFRAGLSAEGRTAILRVDGSELGRWEIDGVQTVRVPVPLNDGYHTVSLAVEPPCPRVYSEALRCLTLDISDLSLGDFVPGDFVAVRFRNGVVLERAQVAPGDTRALEVWLWWQFSAPRSDADIRFIHVFNETGTLVAQHDSTLGPRAAGQGVSEVVPLELPPDLPAGTYRVFVGWYTWPDGVRFGVVSDVPGAPDGSVWVGEYTVATGR